MKKHIVLAVILLCTTHYMQAQLAGAVLYESNQSGPEQKLSAGYKKNCFGLDVGIGSIHNADATVLDIGFRYLHNFSPYWGWDVFKIKAFFSPEHFVESLTPQIMSGFRVNSPRLANILAAYTGIKTGYGYNFEYEYGGFCLEWEIGINIGKTIFLAYAYNYQAGNYEYADGRYTYSIDIKQKYSAFRLGFNF